MFHHWPYSSQDNEKGEQNTAQEYAKAYRKPKYLERNGYALKKGKYQVAGSNTG